jgi:NAD(P)-dependent dehydrogenase (short-subunit alcohol dehydrogenase family)
MKIVVVTGSTRGIGLALAQAFLERGCAVVVSGRGQAACEAVVAALGVGFEPDRLLGHACDVTDPVALQGLWDAAVARFGRVDVWINNAGIAHGQARLWEHDPALFGSIAATNLAGAMSGSAVAIRGMLAQGGGALYNMEGLGSDGRRVDGMIPYGATKRALRYIDEALAKELAGTAVIAGSILPGMVVTDLLLAGLEGPPERVAQARKIFTILADRPETVAPWIADKVLANTRNGARISWLTNAKAGWRFMTAPFSKRDPLGLKD